MSPLSSLGVALLFVVASSSAVAQSDRTPVKRVTFLKGECLSVTVDVVDLGKREARTTEPKPDAPAGVREAVKFVDRKLAWRVGPKKLTKKEHLAAELDRIASDPACMVPDPTTGGKMLIPVVIKPTAKARWCDVVALLDVVYAAGFSKIALPGLGPVATPLTGRVIGKGTFGGGVLVAPKAAFCVPVPGETKDAIVDVRQDRWVEIKGKKICYFVRDEQGRALADHFTKLAQQAAKKSGTSEFGDKKRKFVDVPLLVRADEWALWSDVHAVMKAATACQPAFWRIDYAAKENARRLR